MMKTVDNLPFRVVSEGEEDFRTKIAEHPCAAIFYDLTLPFNPDGIPGETEAKGHPATYAQGVEKRETVEAESRPNPKLRRTDHAVRFDYQIATLPEITEPVSKPDFSADGEAV